VAINTVPSSFTSNTEEDCTLMAPPKLHSCTLWVNSHSPLRLVVNLQHSPTQYHASRCDSTCTLANGLRQGRTRTKSGNSHAHITCYLSHVLITAQSTDGPDTQSCRAHARQNHKLTILAKIPRTSLMLPAERSFSPLTCDQLIPIGAALPSNRPVTIPSG
jgi:hypothetical protein